jgi:hypothetical protein
MRKIAHNRTSNPYSRNNSCSQYSTLRYFFCTSTDAYFKKKEKYEIHSKDLVNTLNKWIDSIEFPNYEYIGGSLSVCDYKSNDEVPLLRQAKKHLE